MQLLRPETSSRVAVILNANAKRVTHRIRTKFKERWSKDLDIYYSESIEESRDIVGHVLARGYSTLLTGGGDGTIVQTINELYRQTGRITTRSQFQRDHHWLQAVPSPRPSLPAVGVLKLGTGNALASVVGAGHYTRDVDRISNLAKDGAEPLRMELPLLESEGVVFPFAGLGWDAAVLNDYNRLKRRTSSAIFRAITNTAVGYLMAAVGMTVPQMMVRRPPEVEIRTLSEASLLGDDGSVIKRFNRGSLLYRGQMNIVCFSTVPYYGCGFKLFPFTDGLTDQFHLRLSTLSIPEALWNLPSIWQGKFRSPRLLDFHCQRITMSFSRPVPYQLGGDAKGERERLTVGISNAPVELVDYRTFLQPAATSILPRLNEPCRDAAIS